MTGAASVRTQFVESRAIGASNFTAPRLAGALATSARLGLPRYERLQPLGRAAYEAELEPLCRAQGLGVINFFGLARGFFDRQIPQRCRPGQKRHAAPASRPT